jgi:quercetin dioxygenase-like cupin family protein
MAHSGDIAEHPVGLRIKFLETADQSNGDRLRLEVTMPPKFGVSEHYHPWQTERHQVVSGTLRGRVAGQERDYQPGEEVVGPANIPHAWSNPSDHEDLRLITQHGPVGHIELMFEAGVPITGDLMRDRRHRIKHLLRLAVLANEIKEEVIYTGLRNRALMAVLVGLAPIAGRLGYRTEYTDGRGRVTAPPRDRSHRLPSAAVVKTAAVTALVAGGVVGLWWRHRSQTA